MARKSVKKATATAAVARKQTMKASATSDPPTPPTTTTIFRPIPGPTLASASANTPEPLDNDLLAEDLRKKVLEYHRTHRPKNTTKAYAPKQKEWRVQFSLSSSFDILLIMITSYGATAKISFRATNFFLGIGWKRPRFSFSSQKR